MKDFGHFGALETPECLPGGPGRPLEGSGRPPGGRRGVGILLKNW